MLKSSLQALLLASLCFSVGCSDDDGENGGGNEGAGNGGSSKPSNPLPEECVSEVLVNIEWGEDLNAFQYQIDIGFQPGGAAESYILDTPKVSFPINMDRGAHYYFTLIRMNDSGQITRKVADLEIPVCDDREAFQAANPDYSEPAFIKVQW